MTGRSEVLVVVLVGMWSVASVSGDCTKLNSCSCKADKGVIDLSPLKASSGATFKDIQASGDNWVYSWNPCKDFTEKQCKSASACQVSQDKSDSHIIGTQDSATFSAITGSDDVLLAYSAVESGVMRTTQITLKCDPSVDSKLDVQGEQGASALYTMTLTSKYCCPGVNVKGTSGGLSPGTIILIVFVVLVLVYVVAGVILQKAVRKASGREVIPNYSLWSSIPGLIKDGTKFIFSCGRSSYQKI